MDAESHIWFDGELIDWHEASIHFMTHAMHYGTAVFEGIRCYNTPEGPAVFRLHEHMVRLDASARAYSMPMRYTPDQLDQGALDLLRQTELTEAYIRPLVFYGVGGIGPAPSGNPIHTMMAAFYFGAYLGDEGVKNGIRTMVSSWRRINHNSLIPTSKGAGGYLNSMLAKQEAHRAGVDEAIMLNDGGSVSEGSGMNIFTVSDGTVFTPPVSAGILEGITRNTVIELLRSEGVEVVEAEMARGSLYIADEMFVTGTAAEVTPVREVDGRPVGEGHPGPITRKAQDIFQAAVNGKLADFGHWLTFV